MTLRRAHGEGAGALLRSERRPLSELPPLNARDTADGAAMARARGKPFKRGNTAAKGRRPSLALLGVEVADAADPAYRSALRKAEAWRRRRCSELARDHGGALSAGASALVATAALAMAASRYVYGLAAAAGPRGVALFSQAAALGDKARQAELTALDLASREAEARPRSTDPLAELRRRMEAVTPTPPTPLPEEDAG